jgi:uncharacterized protein (DUF305 family)
VFSLRLKVMLFTAALVSLAGTATAQTATSQVNTAAAAGPATTQEQGMTSSGKKTKVPPPTPSTKAYKAAAMQMHKDMAVRYTGEPDEDFAATMVAHHKGAIEMAKVELQYGTDPELRKLAQDIITAQEKEIALMREWLAKHR